jgi:hypothetical protein
MQADLTHQMVGMALCVAVGHEVLNKPFLNCEMRTIGERIIFVYI